jgi:hypothetical protein
VRVLCTAVISSGENQEKEAYPTLVEVSTNVGLVGEARVPVLLKAGPLF